MILFPINYGELLRAEFTRLTSRTWGQCTNATDELLIVYGPKHERENSIFDTSPYLLEPGNTTPAHWDCDGFFVPANRAVLRRRQAQKGPLAIKFWDFRHFRVRKHGHSVYQSGWDNGSFEPSQINWAIPVLSYEEILKRAESLTR